MRGDDIFCQLVWREISRVRAGWGFVSEFRVELSDDFIQGNAFDPAGLA